MKTQGDYSYRSIVRFTSVAALAVATFVGAGFVAPTTASAQARVYQDRDYQNRDYRSENRNWRYQQNRQFSRNDIQRIALVNGYSEGYEEGIEDRANRRRAGYSQSDLYRSGMSGYEGSWRVEREYQNWFRQGFQRGYQDGYYSRTRNRTYERSRYPNYYYYGDSQYGDGRYGQGRYGQVPYGQYPGYSGRPTYDDREGNKDREDVAREAAQNGYNAGFERGQYDASRRNKANPQGHGAYQYGLDGFNPEWGSASIYQQYYRAYFIQGYNDGHGRRNKAYTYRRF
jgi:hypothetical protein